MELNESVKQKYNGYLFYKTEMYNPWSILNYADTGHLENYWINTSTNYLIRQSVSEAFAISRDDRPRSSVFGTNGDFTVAG